MPPARGALLADYLVEVWTTEHGLPQNSVNSIAQTPDGYLWFATFNGLARFDGVRFVNFDSANTPELRSGRLLELSVDQQGALWIITEFHELIRYARGEFQNIEQGNPSLSISSVGRDGKGQVRFGSWDGCFQVENGRLARRIDKKSMLGKQPACYYWGYGPGELWTWLDADLIRLEPLGSTKLTATPFQETGIEIDRQGRAVIPSAKGVFRFENGAWEELIRFPTPHNAQSSVVLEARDGSIWGATFNATVWRLAKDRTFREYKISATPAELHCIFKDAEGSIWCGASNWSNARPAILSCPPTPASSSKTATGAGRNAIGPATPSTSTSRFSACPSTTPCSKSPEPKTSTRVVTLRRQCGQSPGETSKNGLTTPVWKADFATAPYDPSAVKNPTAP